MSRMLRALSEMTVDQQAQHLEDLEKEAAEDNRNTGQTKAADTSGDDSVITCCQFRSPLPEHMFGSGDLAPSCVILELIVK